MRFIVLLDWFSQKKKDFEINKAIEIYNGYPYDLNAF